MDTRNQDVDAHDARIAREFGGEMLSDEDLNDLGPPDDEVAFEDLADDEEKR